MNIQVYVGKVDTSTLQDIVDNLRSQTAYGILESLTEIDFPLPQSESIDVSKWPKGRIFCPSFELRWEQVAGDYQVIFAGQNGQEPPAGLSDRSLDVHSKKDMEYYCWNETNPRLGRTLEYRCAPGRGNISSQNVGANHAGRPGGQAQDLPLPRVIEKIRSNVKLTVREYRDDHGRLVFWRYVEMKREDAR